MINKCTKIFILFFYLLSKKRIHLKYYLLLEFIKKMTWIQSKKVIVSNQVVNKES